MSSDVIISVEKLSKRYRLGEIGATTLRDSVERWWHRVRGRDPNEHMGEVGQAARLRPAGSAGQEKRKAASGKREELGVTPSSLTSPAPQRALRSAAGLPSVKNSGSLTEDNKGNEERAEESPVELSNSPISESSNHRIPESDELWALKDVSFEVKRGEVLGIIGRNGAGKSTLLKILSRITEPTSGRAVLRGRVGSLLEVGTGFHPELSGRDNIYLNGAILGMKRAEITRKFDEIVAFAEVERFIDTPVKRYSSGMYVRLAFAVAAHLDPEVSVIDEVLAVGDAAFQKKCLGKMGDMAKTGRTVLFVSHNMTAIQGLCSRCLLLDQGRIARSGRSQDVVRGYLEEFQRLAGEQSLRLRKDRLGDGRIRIVALRFGTSDNVKSGVWVSGIDGVVEIVYEVSPGMLYRNIEIALGIMKLDQTPLLYMGTKVVRQDLNCLQCSGSSICVVKRLPLEPGQYSVTAEVKQNGVIVDCIDSAALLEVACGDYYGTGVMWPYGGFLSDYSWSHHLGNRDIAGEFSTTGRTGNSRS